MVDILDIDLQLADGAKFVIGPEGGKQTRIFFQFPPKILTDSRTGSWEEAELPGSQPVNVYKTSGARKMTLEWTYVIGARGWNTQDIRTQIINLRRYYTAKASELANAFIVNFYIWKLGGEKPMTCRLGNIDITHGKALYVPRGADGKPDITQAHPVITNVKVAIQPWISGGPEGSAALNSLKPKAAAKGASDTEKAAATPATPEAADAAKSKMDLKGLDKTVPPDWQ
jgi:hypothetical protein